MITAITTYQLPEPATPEEARRNFLSTAPRYQGVTGLFRKYYYLSQDRKTIGGVYLWNSRAEAEAMFTESWRGFHAGQIPFGSFGRVLRQPRGG
jgi:hypothetical protein